MQTLMNVNLAYTCNILSDSINACIYMYYSYILYFSSCIYTCVFIKLYFIIPFTGYCRLYWYIHSAITRIVSSKVVFLSHSPHFNSDFKPTTGSENWNAMSKQQFKWHSRCPKALLKAFLIYLIVHSFFFYVISCWFLSNTCIWGCWSQIDFHRYVHVNMYICNAHSFLVC